LSWPPVQRHLLLLYRHHLGRCHVDGIGPAGRGVTAATETFTVDAAAASQLQVTSTAQTLVAGQSSQPFTVTLEDAFGNVVLNPAR